MKLPLSIIAVSGAVLLSGCPKQPLTLDKDGDRLAPVVGVEVNDLQFIQHALLGQVSEGDQSVRNKEAGVVVLGSDALYLVKGKLGSLNAENVYTIPMAEVEGVANDNTHIQVTHNGTVFLIRPYRFYSDEIESFELLDLLIARSLPEVAAVRVEGFGVGSYDMASNFQNDVPDTDDRPPYYEEHIPGTESNPSNYNGNGTVKDSPYFRPLN